MIKWASNYFSSIPSVFIDGFIACVIGWLLFSQTFLGGDEAAKWISPATKFWLNYILGSLAITFSQLKSFRSNSFSDYQKEKKDANTTFFTKNPPSNSGNI